MCFSDIYKIIEEVKLQAISLSKQKENIKVVFAFQDRKKHAGGVVLTTKSCSNIFPCGLEKIHLPVLSTFLKYVRTNIKKQGP